MTDEEAKGVELQAEEPLNLTQGPCQGSYLPAGRWQVANHALSRRLGLCASGSAGARTYVNGEDHGGGALEGQENHCIPTLPALLNGLHKHPDVLRAGAACARSQALGECVGHRD